MKFMRLERNKSPEEKAECEIDKRKAWSRRQKEQAVSMRMENYWSKYWGGRKCVKNFLMNGPSDDLHVHVPSRLSHPRRPRTVKAYKARKLNLAHKARRKLKYFEGLVRQGKTHMKKHKANYLLHNIDIILAKARRLTEEQKLQGKAGQVIRRFLSSKME